MTDREIKLIAFDLDGTLLTDRKELTLRARRAIGKAIEKGVTILAATGRPMTAMPPEILNFSGIRYYMSSNGAALWDKETGTYIRQAYLTREQTILLVAASMQEDVWREACINGRSHASKEQFERLPDFFTTERVMRYVLDTRKPVERLEDYILTCENRIERVSFFTYHPDRLERIHESIRDIPDIDITSAVPNDLEIGASAASKEGALKYLIELLEIEPDEVMAIGDGHNDIGMIRLSGIGVAMANAMEAVHEAADFVTDSNEEDGVAKVIERFVLGEEKCDL